MQAGYPGQLMDVLNNFYAQSQSARISAEKNSEKYSTYFKTRPKADFTTSHSISGNLILYRWHARKAS